MAWPMIEWVLDTHYAALHRAPAPSERSVIVFGAMEATLTPLMEAIETRFAGIKVFSLPSVDHPQWGRHIELGVKGRLDLLDAAYAALREGLAEHAAPLGPELVR
jgi:molybdopterin-biosynthesis enzyme MoeA-like protein